MYPIQIFPRVSYVLAALVVAGACSSLIIAYALLRVDLERPELGWFVTSILLLVAVVLLTADDVVLLYREGLGELGFVPAITAVGWLVVALGFVGYTAYRLLA